MDMGKIIENSFKYPASNWKRLLIFGLIILVYELSVYSLATYIEGSILVLLLIIPFIISYLLMEGYRLRVIGSSIRGGIEVPEFNNWLKMLGDGVRMFIVGLVYGIIPGIILGVGLLLLFLGSFSIQMVGVLIILLGLVIFIIVTLITVMAISNMAYYGEVSAAFKLSEIRGRIKKIGWLDYILVLIVLGVLCGVLLVVAALISIIPILGMFLASLIIYPYIYLVIARAYGLIYQETLEDEPEEALPGIEDLPLETNHN
jgi:hypothetical protein